MISLAEARQYLQTHGGRRAARRLVTTYIAGRQRSYLLQSNYETVAGLPLSDNGLVFRLARPDDLPALTERFTQVPPSTFQAWLGPNHFLYLALAGNKPAAFRCDSTIVSPGLRSILHLRPDQVFMVDISTAPAFRRRGITRLIRIAMARHMLRLGFRDSWGVQRVMNREALAAFDRTPDVVQRFGTLTRRTMLGRVQFSLTPSRWLSPEHIGALAQLAADCVPRASRLALLFNPGTTIAPPGAAEAVLRAVAKLGIELRMIPLTETADQVGAFAEAFAEMAREGAEAVVVLDDPMYREHRQTVVALAGTHRLPALYEGRAFARAGGLLAYSPPGPPPPAWPLELSPRIKLDPLGGTPGELIVNVAAATALGLTVPRSVLLRATEVTGA
ncbi:MAG TPA: hypothetical protein VFR64_21850 [Methylomirabilota bacterium]|nr:hypothetical protein [Methylomirabilota bacterium]